MFTGTSAEILALVLPEFLVALGLTLITSFFAIHAMQHVADPNERAAWLLIIVPFTIIGSAVYGFTKYRAFRRIGKGRLMKPPKPISWRNLTALSEPERNDSLRMAG